MGEKETGAAAAGAPSAFASGGAAAAGRESSAPSVGERTSATDDWTAPAALAAGGGESTPAPSDGAVVKSKSNISNNRESAPGEGGGGQPGIAIGDPGVNGNIMPAEDEGGGTPNPVETSNLNLSKSNINRAAQPGDGGVPAPSETAIVKSKSNITNN